MCKYCRRRSAAGGGEARREGFTNIYIFISRIFTFLHFVLATKTENVTYTVKNDYSPVSSRPSRSKTRNPIKKNNNHSLEPIRGDWTNTNTTRGKTKKKKKLECYFVSHPTLPVITLRNIPINAHLFPCKWFIVFFLTWFNVISLQLDRSISSWINNCYCRTPTTAIVTDRAKIIRRAVSLATVSARSFQTLYLYLKIVRIRFSPDWRRW